MRFPSIRDVAQDLRDTQQDIRRLHDAADLDDGDGNVGVDVRLQVTESGSWAIHTGSADYDQDHRGYWGAGFLPYGRANLSEIARDLIDQAKDQAAA